MGQRVQLYEIKILGFSILLLPCLSITFLYLIDIDEEGVLQLCLDFITGRIAHAFKYLVCLNGFGVVGTVDEIEEGHTGASDSRIGLLYLLQYTLVCCIYDYYGLIGLR